MYGLLVESIVDFTKRKYGEAVWERVRIKAKIENFTFSTHQQYSETLFLKLIKALADVTNSNVNDILEALGADFVGFVSLYGYDRILKVLGRHMRDFLNGLDNLHEYMRFSYPKLKPPSFFVEKESPDGILLHYRSKRKGYLYYVKGQIREVGKIFYNLDVDIKVVSETTVTELTHVIYDLKFKNTQYKHMSSALSLNAGLKTHTFNLPVKSEIFFELFPFHVVFNRTLNVVSVGTSLAQALKNIEGDNMMDLFNLIRPLIPFTWENIIGHTNNVFELTSIEPVQRVTGDPGEKSEIYNTTGSIDSEVQEHLRLKGQMMFVKEWDSIIFLATPVLENLDIMFSTGFFINDLSMHDSSRDLVLVGTQQSAELKLALDQEKQKSKALEDSMKKLDIEMKRTDQLLYQMIPKKIADRLRSGEPAMNLCEIVPSCTILFSDVVGFTQTCAQLKPMEVVAMLNGMYTRFDKSLEAHNVYKVETIGDAYMVVSGLPEKNNTHAVEIVEMGFDMLNTISTLINPATGEPLKIRIGCHTGSVVAGVVGLKMPRYCLFGETVNVANKMESTSEAMKIHITNTTLENLPKKKYKTVENGKIEVRGQQNEIKTYFVLTKYDEDGNSMKCPFMEAYQEGKRMEAAAAAVARARNQDVTPPKIEITDASSSKPVKAPEPVRAKVAEPEKPKPAVEKSSTTDNKAKDNKKPKSTELQPPQLPARLMSNSETSSSSSNPPATSNTTNSSPVKQNQTSAPTVSPPPELKILPIKLDPPAAPRISNGFSSIESSMPKDPVSIARPTELQPSGNGSPPSYLQTSKSAPNNMVVSKKSFFRSIACNVL